MGISMNANELRDLGDAELAQKLGEAKEELFNLRFQLATGQLDNYMTLGEVRRDIARVLTVQRERELAVAEEDGES
ncbi:MAG: 50S ribosomal protein L29 [Egibacteraceae bacterium]